MQLTDQKEYKLSTKKKVSDRKKNSSHRPKKKKKKNTSYRSEKYKPSPKIWKHLGKAASS